ncbi:hypothetical protein [Myxococcus sp. CA033]|uniref:hypothetical protein n=2 Tax=unclassified Myxococcus TaxID=2648731 RepID=UPI001C2D416D|nr:hypothetical protein [Myxococcus sp. CA033]
MRTWKPAGTRRWPRIRPWRLLGRPATYAVLTPRAVEPPPATPGNTPPPPRDAASSGAAAPPPPPWDTEPGDDTPPPSTPVPFDEPSPEDLPVPAEPDDEPPAPDAQEVLVSPPRIAWSRSRMERYPFTQLPAGGGVYVVEEDGHPLHVGETDNFQTHWRQRLTALYELGFTRRGGRLSKPITVWFGPLMPNSPAARARAKRALRRALTRSGVVPAGRLRDTGADPEAIEESDGRGLPSLQGLLPPSDWGVQAARALGLAPPRRSDARFGT